MYEIGRVIERGIDVDEATFSIIMSVVFVVVLGWILFRTIRPSAAKLKRQQAEVDRSVDTSSEITKAHMNVVKAMKENPEEAALLPPHIRKKFLGDASAGPTIGKVNPATEEEIKKLLNRK